MKQLKSQEQVKQIKDLAYVQEELIERQKQFAENVKATFVITIVLLVLLIVYVI